MIQRRPGKRDLSCGICLVIFAVALNGCGSSTDPPPPNDANNMRGIIRYYATATRQLGRPPAKMEELEAVLAGAVENPSEFFTSTRDGKVYAVVWGLKVDSLPEDTIIAYEREGVDGKRMVMPISGEPREVTEEEFAQIDFPKSHKPGVD